MTVSVMAVQYPKKPYTGSGAAYHAPVTYQQQAGQKHGSLTPVGASTPSVYPPIGASAPTVGGPRRVHAGGSTPPDPGDDYDWVDDNGNLWVYNEGAQQWEAGSIGTGEFWKPADVDAENQIPLGSTWVMLLFAALFATSIALRRRPQA